MLHQEVFYNLIKFEHSQKNLAKEFWELVIEGYENFIFEKIKESSKIGKLNIDFYLKFSEKLFCNLHKFDNLLYKYLENEINNYYLNNYLLIENSFCIIETYDSFKKTIQIINQTRDSLFAPIFDYFDYSEEKYSYNVKNIDLNTDINDYRIKFTLRILHSDFIENDGNYI